MSFFYLSRRENDINTRERERCWVGGRDWVWLSLRDANKTTTKHFAVSSFCAYWIDRTDAKYDNAKVWCWRFRHAAANRYRIRTSFRSSVSCYIAAGQVHEPDVPTEYKKKKCPWCDSNKPGPPRRTVADEVSSFFSSLPRYVAVLKVFFGAFGVCVCIKKRPAAGLSFMRSDSRRRKKREDVFSRWVVSSPAQLVWKMGNVLRRKQSWLSFDLKIWRV